MSGQQLDKTSRRYTVGCIAGFLILTVLVVLGPKCASEILQRHWQAEAREYTRRQIANVKRGKQQNAIFVSINEINRFQMREFIKAQADLDALDDYILLIEYSHGTDDFLREIAGLRGAREIRLHQDDVSDVGLAYVALIPDMAKLSIDGYGLITAAGLEHFRSSPKLESLDFYLKPSTVVTLSDLLALPNLRKLKVRNETEKSLPLGNMQQQPQFLTELILINPELTPEEIQQLGEQLPNCKITANPHRRRRSAIAPPTSP